ncbi:hypothetical protein LDL08_35555 [Nonomuraea glycinis]|uniref:Novel STAND NTPase 1 domain-containing protein n=1 Tax=Nonomuraea glycinis TaxID=2047744 RepID=A0A918ABS7_9ACTN|nr:hypothetical protein [Nonomuraea glycinis]MCA2181492.1 hypothetical protein [Nonomuraea glycinis]GGP14591.1 hypothetical protein GCM10012278_71010 [Nonomuraea glycinis]
MRKRKSAVHGPGSISEEPAEPADGAASPYAGLATFRAEDAARFFGRERVTEDLVARVTEQR